MVQLLPKLPAAGESEVIARAMRKEEAAVRLIIQQHNRRLFRLARSITRDDSEAEDVVQAAYVHAFTKLAEFRGESSLGTWLSRIVMNEALGRIRRERSAPTRISLECLEPAGKVIAFPLTSKQPDPERTMAQNEIRLILERAIDDLPEPFRVVLVARVIEEMSVEETAELLGLRPQTVKTRLHRARRLLRASLDEQIGPALTEAFPFDGRRCQQMAGMVLKRLDAMRRFEEVKALRLKVVELEAAIPADRQSGNVAEAPSREKSQGKSESQSETSIPGQIDKDELRGYASSPCFLHELDLDYRSNT